jgi:hypothetical protein
LQIIWRKIEEAKTNFLKFGLRSHAAEIKNPLIKKKIGTPGNMAIIELNQASETA